MTDAELLARWRAEEIEQPTGSEFADLDGRMTTDPTPWDFTVLSLAALTRARRALDMGTGGGETSSS